MWLRAIKALAGAVSAVAALIVAAESGLSGAAAAQPEQQRLGLSREEVTKQTPGLVKAALAGPLKNVPELVYAAGNGCDFSWGLAIIAPWGWGADYDKYRWDWASPINEPYDQSIPRPVGCGLYRFNPHTGARTAILKNRNGGIGGVCVDYDGRRIVFSYVADMKARMGTAARRAHLYEIRPDGSGLRQLTDGPFDDMEPCFLPNGEIIFSSSRTKRFIGCCGFLSQTLFLCSADGSHIRRHNAHLETQLGPSVLADGRVAFSQYEYTSMRGNMYLTTALANPDGSGYGSLAGPVFGTPQCSCWNTLHFPCQVPGTTKISAMFYRGESTPDEMGWIVHYDMSRGPTDLDAMRFISPHMGKMNWLAALGRYPWPTLPKEYHELNWSYPYPLSADCTLVTTRGGVHVMDGQGRHECLCKETDGGGLLGWVRPLCARPREPVLPSQIDPRRDTGTIVMANADMSRNDTPYHAASLLILEELPRPVPGWANTDSLGAGFFLDRVIGTVPIEADGSACFEVPADRELFFVLQDQRGRAIKKMRSWTALRPGETRSCIGCHEERTMSQSPIAQGTLLAMRRPPRKPFRPAYVPDQICFHRDVQPILDRYCVRCHDSTAKPGQPMLTGDLTVFNSLAYDQLHEAKQFEVDIEFNNGNDKPNTKGSAVSPLLDMLDHGHYDVHATPQEIELVRLWIDSGASYQGAYAASQHTDMWYYGNLRGMHTQGRLLRRPQAAPCDLDVLVRRCDSCHVSTPGGRAGLNKGFSGDCQWPWAISGPGLNGVYADGGRRYFVNLTHPDRSLLVLAPLARSAGGLGLCGGKPGDWKPQPFGLANGPVLKKGQRARFDGIFADKHDADYIKLVTSIQSAGDYLYKDITRPDTPNFRPPAGWVWIMKQWGILDPKVNPMKDPIDVFAVEHRYWESAYPKAQKPAAVTIPTPSTSEKGK